MGDYKGRERRRPGCEGDDSRCDYADDAAERAVGKMFAILGVDIDDPKQVKDFQESLRIGETLRKAAQTSWTAFWWAFGLSLGAALIYMLRVSITALKP